MSDTTLSQDLKALIFDLDGTAVPNSPNGVPTQAVKDAVNAAGQKVKAACATGREWGICQHIVQQLELTSPCIISGGAQIVNPKTGEPVWQRTLSAEKLREVVMAVREFPYVMGAAGDPSYDKKLSEYEYFFDKPIVYIVDVPHEDAEKMVKLLEPIQDIKVLPVGAWTSANIDIHITHKEASKGFALQEWARMENIDLAQVMVVGDSGNDLPLFEYAGFKVAMGNGSSELKELADWIAPSQEVDGLVTAIEKFIL